MHQHVPELFQVLKHVRSAAPVTPCLGIPFKRSLGGSNDRDVHDSVGAGDAQATPASGSPIEMNIPHGCRTIFPTVSRLSNSS